MSERIVLEIANPITQTVAAFAQQLLANYSTGILSEIEIPVSFPVMAAVI